jgi:hypothetical protein
VVLLGVIGNDIVDPGNVLEVGPENVDLLGFDRVDEDGLVPALNERRCSSCRRAKG